MKYKFRKTELAREEIITGFKYSNIFQNVHIKI